MSVHLPKSNLFKPTKVGNVTLKHRIIYAPAGKFRCADDYKPTDSRLEYYLKIAENNGGLLTSEAATPSLEAGLLPHAPMIKTQNRVKP